MRSLRSGMRMWLNRHTLPWAMVLVSSLSAGLLVAVLALLAPLKGSRERLAIGLWTVAPLVIMVLHSLLVGRMAQGTNQALEALLVLAALQARAPGQRLRTALVVALFGLSTVSVVAGALRVGMWERLYGTTTTPLAGVTWSGGVFDLGSERATLKTNYAQTFRVPRQERPQGVVMHYRLSKGSPSLLWSSSATVAQSVQHEGSTSSVTVSTGSTDRGQLEREYTSSEPLGGQTLRVAVETRGMLRPESTSKCSGIALQVRTEAWSGTCMQLPSGVVGWKRSSLEWTVPANRSTHNVWLSVSLGPNSLLGIRNVRVERRSEGRWIALDPSEPSGIAFYVAWRRDLGSPLQFSFVKRVHPTNHWQSTDIPLTPRPSGMQYATIRAAVGPGFVAQVTQSARSGSMRLRQAAPANRQGLWFAHPNLLGHTAATGAVAAMALAGRSGYGSLLVLLASAPVLVASGSRTATATVLVAALLLLGLGVGRSKWRRGLSVVVALAAILGLTAVFIDHIPEAPRVASLNEVVPRSAIWMTAVRSIASDPWRGPGDSELATQGDFPSGDEPNHAHNVFLQAAIENGVVGTLALLWFTGRLIQLSWRRLRWRGVVLMFAIVVLNTFDVSLFYGSVALPLLVTISSRDQERMRTNLTEATS